MSLADKKIAILIAPRGTEEPEFTKPKQAVEAAGGKVTVIGLESGEAHTNNNDLEPGGAYKVDQVVSDVAADNFDALIIPGGSVGSDKLRADESVISFVRSFFEQKKPVGVICHGPWLLVDAGILNGRTVTSYPSIKSDLTNAGANWVDEEVVVDNELVTSRSPDDLPAFCAKIVETFKDGRQAP